MDSSSLLRSHWFAPSSEQIQAFVNDESPNAYEKVVNSLLKSTFFGEKWARHWLDLMRYAESYGHEFDYGLPHATEYRDYVIRALNEDVPYSQFLQEHLAGDLIANPRLNKELSFNESIIELGSGISMKQRMLRPMSSATKQISWTTKLMSSERSGRDILDLMRSESYGHEFDYGLCPMPRPQI